MTEEQYTEALQAASQAEVIVLALGERSDMSGEAGSRSNIRLPQAQLELVKRLKTLNKPMVAVLFNGRPLDLHGVIEEVDAVLEAWFPGGEGGAAIADLLYGDAEPTGRLTMSFPQSVGQVPVYYNHFNTGRPQLDPNTKERYVSQYLDVPNEPLFPFGYGLSYTNVAYDSVQLSGDTLTPGQELTVKVQVTNTGTRPIEETVQFYIRDISGDTVRPMKELKDFCKVLLTPGESREVKFVLTEPQLRYHHADLSFSSDSGEFAVFTGPNSRDTSESRFRLVK